MDEIEKILRLREKHRSAVSVRMVDKLAAEVERLRAIEDAVLYWRDTRKEDGQSHVHADTHLLCFLDENPSRPS